MKPKKEMTAESEFVFERDALVEVLSLMATVAPKRPNRPSLMCAHFEASGKICRISATDLDVSLTVTLDMLNDVAEPKQFCLPVGTLRGVLSACTDETVRIGFAPDCGCVVGCGADCFEMVQFSAEEYPERVGLPDGAPDVSLKAPALALLMSRVGFCVANESGRYAIKGVCLARSGEKLDAVATDGRRLSLASQKCNFNADEISDVILPLKFAQMIERLDKHCPEDSEAALHIAGQSVAVGFRIDVGYVVLSAVRIDGKFPDYGKVIPKKLPHTATLMSEAFLSALTKACFFADEYEQTVVFVFSGKMLRIESADPEKGRADVTVECDYSGPDMRIELNARMLSAVVRALGVESFSFSFDKGKKPFVIRAGDDYVYTQMPIGRD